MTKHQTPMNNEKHCRSENISMDAALATSTLFACLAQLATPDASTVRELFLSVEGLWVDLDSPGRLDPTSEEATEAWARAKLVLGNKLASSCDAAAEVLARAVTIDGILRKLDERNPTHTVAMLYCVARLLKDDNRLTEVQRDAEEQVGKNWLWPIIWAFAVDSETVKRRWDQEESKGNLDGWKDECQKFANNYWLARKKEFGEMRALKDKMIASLRERLGLTGP